MTAPGYVICHVQCPECDNYYPWEDSFQGSSPVKPGTVLNHYCCPSCRYEWGEEDEEPHSWEDQ